MTKEELLEQIENGDVFADDHDMIQVEGEWRENVYHIISKAAFLFGVPERIFSNEKTSPKMETYNELRGNKNARIIRNLCLLRTSIEKHFAKINTEITYNLRSLSSLKEYVPTEAITELSQDGINILYANYRPAQYIVEINKAISDRINNCKSLFPIWLKWEYLRDLFIMPNGTKEEGAKTAAAVYYSNMSKYPYQVYMNWPGLDNGNILLNDKKFITGLYAKNGDVFTDLAKVTDASIKTKNGIYRFLENSSRTTMIVDCENSDPYKLYAALNNLDENSLLSKIVKIVLFDDVHTASAWKILEEFTDLEIEHIELTRLMDYKSFLDVQLTARACKEHYTNNIDSFLLVSSDSDYWGLVSELNEANFLVMVEQSKCSPTLKTSLNEKGITYCFIDDFCTGNSNEIKEQALIREIEDALDRECNFNIDAIVRDAFFATRADMTEGEKAQFIKKYIKPMKLVVDTDGSVYIALGE